MHKTTMKILALDDEPFMLKLLTRILEGLGFTNVTSCSDGAAALDWVNAYAIAPDVILLDLNMPGMDGIEFVRKLVEHRYEGSLVLVSGEDERVMQTAEKLVRAHNIPVLGHLSKPVVPARLLTLLSKWRPAASSAAAAPRKIYDADSVRAAIEHGELVNYYQPKVTLADGAVVGVETLVRWNHPEDGLVFPDQFIGVAEAGGLINDLTHAVLMAAFFQSRSWKQAGLDLVVAVNVSMDDLNLLDFPDFVARLAIAAGITPQDVVLEVTESRLALDQRAPLDILTRLRLKRFRLSIDDFGTGHSSLAQLRDMPFEELKIDHSFVHGAWSDETLRAMFDASLGLAKQLGMTVVAEGVEDRQDWDLAQRAGCDMAQGYFIAHPMPADELVAWIASWNARMPGLREESL
ncbi:EAL domain-containing response regulator [soil metagenome]